MTRGQGIADCSKTVKTAPLIGEISFVIYPDGMQSNNPVLTRYEPKNGQSGYAYDEGVAAYQQAAAGGSGADVDAAFAQVTAAGGARITINDVIIKTFAVFVLTVIFAVVGWNLAPSMPWIMWVGMIGGLGGFILPIVFGALNDLIGVWTSCFMLLFALVAIALTWMHFAIRRMDEARHPELRRDTDLPEVMADAPRS